MLLRPTLSFMVSVLGRRRGGLTEIVTIVGAGWLARACGAIDWFACILLGKTVALLAGLPAIWSGQFKHSSTQKQYSLIDAASS